MLKSIIPSDRRQWNNDAVEWRIVGDIAELHDEFGRRSVPVTVVGERGQAKREPDERESVDHWRRKFEAMAEAAKRMHEEKLQLQEEHEETLRKLKEVAAKASAPPASGSWAEQLFTAVGESRIDAVFKAMSRCLHPDVKTGDTRLMQQLNDARGRLRNR
ncbi:hypothetical protein [Nocardia wallacei]|uniref:hypothetical protein n=1 Tax=Nocardia wallacei TaxID=480035 RepID=UPI0024545A5D|nr:hypothetical protein [Nocardia wallacei]